jgi:hypothetical protein
LKFSNSKESFEYYCYFFGPLITIVNFYGSFIDVVLSIERIVLLSKKLEWFRKIDPKVLCLIFVIIASLVIWPYWTLYRPASLNVMLNETTPFVVYYYNVKMFTSGSYKYFQLLPYIIDIIPVVVEITFNIIAIFLIKKFTKNKMRILATEQTRTDQIIIKSNAITNTNNLITMRARKMEIKLTILAIFLSTLSALY